MTIDFLLWVILAGIAFTFYYNMWKDSHDRC